MNKTDKFIEKNSESNLRSKVIIINPLRRDLSIGSYFQVNSISNEKLREWLKEFRSFQVSFKICHFYFTYSINYSELDLVKKKRSNAKIKSQNSFQRHLISKNR